VVAKPRLSTGGGDHFNAGFAFGRLQGLSPLDATRAAVLVSSLYVERGRSPRFGEVQASAQGQGV
jgi:sugar/nucleoside kinase (ribokinase family)